MATNAELLADARAAYHSLMTGTSARVVVDQNGERVEYTAANAARLMAYIQYLENLVTPKTVRGPAGVIF
jgi:hypothetical protein